MGICKCFSIYNNIRSVQWKTAVKYNGFIKYFGYQIMKKAEHFPHVVLYRSSRKYDLKSRPVEIIVSMIEKFQKECDQTDWNYKDSHAHSA